MSRHEAFDASRHEARVASRHKAYGTAVRTLLLPGTSNVQMTWSVDFVQYNSSTKNKITTKAGTVILHDRYYHTAIWLMGSASGRGECDISNWIGEAYSAGTPDPQNDEHNSNSLTLQSGIAGTFAWNGWTALTGESAQASHVDTGTTMEFYGRSTLVDQGSTQNVKGIYCRFPRVNIGGTPPFEAINWITAYFDGANLNVAPSTGSGATRIEVRAKVIITV
jgi:hypothetical protein